MTSLPPSGGGGAGTGGGGRFDPNTGNPHLLRPVPGNRSRYYDTITGEEMSQYEYRKFRRSLSPEQLAYHNNVSSETRYRETGRYGMQVRQYGTLVAGIQGADYVPDVDNGRIIRSEKFQQSYAELRYREWEVSWAGGSRDPNGPLANALVQMGLRLPGDTFRVGESPKGHAAAVALFYSQGGYGPNGLPVPPELQHHLTQ